MPWTEKHRPKNLTEIRGQDIAIEQIKSFIDNFANSTKKKISSKKAIALHGPPGIGKTSLAYAIANEIDLEIFELNASDLRNKIKLREVLKPVTAQKSLLKKGKIILVDEADGISAMDRGGLTELLTLISSTPYPIIITANDIWSKKLSALRKKSELIQLKEIDYKTIKDVMIQILKKENYFVENDVLTKIAIKAKGDLRAAINDLQAVSNMDDSSQISFDERNKETDIFNALRLIFKGKPTNELLQIFNSINMPIDQILLWVEENIPAEYKNEELARAYELLSRADIFKGRIYRQQYWRFLVYQNIFLSYGISSAKRNIKTGFTSYKKPTRILKIWLNNQKNIKKKSIAEKYAQYVHIGKKRAMNEFQTIKQIIKYYPDTQKQLKLNEEEIEYIMR